MQWFGGFQILKILNILRTSDTFKDEDVVSSVNQLRIIEKDNNAKNLLEKIRLYDQNP